MGGPESSSHCTNVMANLAHVFLFNSQLLDVIQEVMVSGSHRVAQKVSFSKCLAGIHVNGLCNHLPAKQHLDSISRKCT